MLKQRVITALVLVAILLPALFASTAEPLAGLTLVLIAAATWEWGRINGIAMRGALRLGSLCLIICLWLWHRQFAYFPHPMLWLITGAAWVLMGAKLLHVGVDGWGAIPRWIRLALGLVVLLLTWVALYQAKLRGTNFLLSVLALVWAADIAAYFSGRRFGRRKLAINISPGKSWEGVVGGMVSVLIVGVVWCWTDQTQPVDSLSVYSLMLQRGWLFALLGTVFLVAMSVVGDLIESLIKRSAGVKDSSQLLPGHGGVLDRVDAILPTIPLALMLVGG
jgi:phosphatidate cytidylyltransferase